MTNFTWSKPLAKWLTLLLIPLVSIVTSPSAGFAQCTIDKTGCPPADLTSPTCATGLGNYNGQQVLGANVSWTAPSFNLNCGTGGAGYNFEMLWELPENTLAGGCWGFNRVQRTGGGGTGAMNLWKSSGSGNPYIITPLLVFSGNTDFLLNLGGTVAFSVNISFINAQGVQGPVVQTINVPDGPAADYIFQLNPGTGSFKVRFEFLYNNGASDPPGGNTLTIDRIAIDAFLPATTSCTGGIDFTVTGPTPGFYPVGITPIIYTATYTPSDGPQIISTCTFDVVVTAPVITLTCPTPQASYNADAGKCTAGLSFTANATVGNCGGAATVKYYVGMNEISFPYDFPVGTTTVKAVATLANAADKECTFDVVVVDNQNPVVTCPANASFGTDNGACTATKTLIAEATDNCGVQSIAYAVGGQPITFPYAFPIGITTVNVLATDIHGRTASCSYTVTVTDDEDPVIVTCAGNQTINTNAQCSAVVPDFTGSVVTSDNCSQSGPVTVTQSPAAGSQVGPGSYQITITATDGGNNSVTCTATLTVVGVIDAVNDNASGINGNTGGTAVGNVLANDLLNCGQAALANVNLTVVTPSTDPGVVLNTGTGAVTVAPGTPAGTYTIVYQICDKVNPANCDQATITINVRAGTADLSITKSGPANVNSGDQITYTITVTNNGLDISTTTTVTDNLPAGLSGGEFSTNGGSSWSPWNGTYQYGSLGISASFSILVRGTVGANVCADIVNTATVSGNWPDPNPANNSASATTSITNTTPPTITCPPSLQTTSNGSCEGVLVNVGTAIATNNCSGISTVEGTRSDGLALDAPYPVGVTTITWVAKDANGQEGQSCQQTITVVDGFILANYTFSGAPDAPTPIPANETAPGVTSQMTSAAEYFTQNPGTETGDMAFKTNLEDNPAIAVKNSSVPFSYDFVLSGPELVKFKEFKVYVQASRLPDATNILDFAYSLDGVNYTVNGSLDIPLQNTWYQKMVDWSSISALNYPTNLYIKLIPRNTSPSGQDLRIKIDNFQVFGQIDPVSISVVSKTNPTCESPSSGSINVVGSGGTPPYMYNLNGGTYQAGANFNNLASGTYTMGVKDSKGCVATIQVSIQIPPNIDAVTDNFSGCGEVGFTTASVFANDIVNCVGATAATVVVTGSSFNTPGITFNAADGTITVAPGTSAGTYQFSYTICDVNDNTNCDQVSGSVTVECPLPTTGLELTGRRNGADVRLNWVTLTEQNTSHFIIERSFDGVNFAAIPSNSKVPAAGNSTARSNYESADRNVTAPLVYYRVKLYDINGGVRISNIVSLRYNDSRNLRVFPNPVIEFVTIEFGDNGIYQVDLIGVNGQIMMIRKDLEINNGMHSITIPRGNLASGAYNLRILNKTTGKVDLVKLIIHQRNTP